MENTARLSLLAASAVALLAAPTIASAQAAPAGMTAVALAKSEAILGGAPSSLAAILAQQSGLPTPAVQPLLQPASYRPSPTPAVMRNARPLYSPAVLSCLLYTSPSPRDS